MQRLEQIHRLENKLAQWDQWVGVLQNRYEHAERMQGAACWRELKSARQQRERARARLAQLRLMEAQSWTEDDLQTAVLHIFDTIGERLSRFGSHLRR